MERHVFVFLLGCLAFNWPFLEMFRVGLVGYLYGTWLAFIFLLAVISRASTAAGNPAATGQRSNRG